MKASDRIILNTIAQYVRTIINTLLALYSTRLVLEVLGASEFGIYTLIAGVISMLSFITNALVRTTQRYLSYSLGSNSINKTVTIYNNCLFLHIIIGLVVVLFLELCTPLISFGFLNIPTERISAATHLFQIVIVILFITFITSPIKSTLVAHENIVFISIIEVVDAILKVLLVYFLQLIDNCDKLLVYGLILLGIQFLNLILYTLFAYFKYEECKSINIKLIDFSLLKEILGFASWNIYNTGCIVGRNQGVAIIINKYFGLIANTSYGIAFQVSGCVNVISNSIKNAFAPQIMKAEGAGDRTSMLRKAILESKICFSLLALVCIPVMFEMDTILSFWLGSVPQNAVLFCNMILVASLADTLTTGLCTINLAIGKLKHMSIYSYTIKILTIPVIFIFSYFNFNLVIIAISFVVFELISALVRIPIISHETNTSNSELLLDLVLKHIPSIVLSSAISYIIVSTIDYNFRIIFTLTVSILIYIISFIYISLNKSEREILKDIVLNIINRISYH